MKTSKFLTLILSFVAVLAITSCVEDDDYTVPNSLGDEENAALAILLSEGTEVDIATVKAMYTGDADIEQITNDIFVKGYVSSSDATGNFFKEFFIQDTPTNPTGALKVILNRVDTYNQFNKGREVYINLKGLYIGEERVGNGIITIGGGTETDNFGTTVTSLNENQININLLRSETTADMIPLPLTFSSISGANVGMLVSVDNVEFADNLAGERYFNPAETFDTRRTMQACEGFDYANFQLETSSFASFKEELLPTGNGTIIGVVNKTFDGSQLILALNTTDDVNMNDARCTPLDISDFNISFEETFETMPTNTTIASNGWTSYAEVGNFNWRALTTTDSGNPGPGNKIASMGAYNSGSPVNIAWLISPAIDLDAVNLEFLNFKSSNSFDDDSDLELLISTDWDGTQANVTSATWTSLPGTIVSDDVFFQDWVDSGLIDLSSYSGNGYIAFKYIGGDNSGSNSPNTGTIDGTFEIDNFQILAEN